MREFNTRRDVYLTAAEAVARTNTTLAAMADLSLADPDIGAADRRGRRYEPPTKTHTHTHTHRVDLADFRELVSAPRNIYIVRVVEARKAGETAIVMETTESNFDVASSRWKRAGEAG
jgi:CRISPR/Cas system-associated exonuclease Cas4 (RecB family)